MRTKNSNLHFAFVSALLAFCMLFELFFSLAARLFLSLFMLPSKLKERKKKEGKAQCVKKRCSA